jgi:hypothetical protein
MSADQRRLVLDEEQERYFVSTKLFEREFEKKVKIRQDGIYFDIRIVTKGLVKAGARSNR